MMRYEVKDEHDKVHIIHAHDPTDACKRIADLRQVRVIAWRAAPEPVHVWTGAPA